MTIQKMTVLGISANSRLLGLAVLAGADLIDYRTFVFKKQWSDVKLQRMLSRMHTYVQRYNVACIALINPPLHHLYPEAHALISAISTFCTTHTIPFNRYDLCHSHQLFSSGKAKQQSLMTALTNRYPVLDGMYQKERRNKNRYHHKVFEAVSVAILHYMSTTKPL